MPKPQKSVPTPHPLLSYSEGVLFSEPLPTLGADIIVFPEILPTQPPQTAAIASETPKVSALADAAPVSGDTAGLGLLIIGTDEDDSLSGTELGDAIYGLGGNDHIRGFGGNDFIDGGDGKDYLYGDAGDDEVHGGLGNDSLTGGDGWDSLFGGDGRDFLYGGESGDVLDGGAGQDLLSGGAGGDFMRGGIGDDTYYVDTVDDAVAEFAGEGDDTINLLNFEQQEYTLQMHVENLRYSGSGGITAYGNTLNNHMASNSGSSVSFFGGDGNDVLFGSEAADALSGGVGNDEIHASVVDDPLPEGRQDNGPSEAGDYLDGGDGDDRLFGETGHDLFRGGKGRDYMHGGGGDDVFVFHAEADFEQGIVDTIAYLDEGDRIEIYGLDRNAGISFIDDTDGGTIIRIGADFETYWIEVALGSPELVESQLLLL
jgi:Ca2+-binding RTX toxin-like protein